MERNTSPGRYAAPPGIFSTAGTSATTFFFILSLEANTIAHITAAPPLISICMPSAESPVFMLMPPVSKVTPLPTSTIGFSLTEPPLYSITINCGSSLEPCATPKIAPAFNFLSSFRPSMVILIFASFASFLASETIILGVISPPGVLEIRRQ